MPMAAPSETNSPMPIKTRLGDLMPSFSLNQPMTPPPMLEIASFTAPAALVMPFTSPCMSIPPRSENLAGISKPIA
ncbi:hypothetical protein D3C71_1975950 [compost metagenome]